MYTLTLHLIVHAWKDKRRHSSNYGTECGQRLSLLSLAQSSLEFKMAEDVNIQGSAYDEDLCENPFFKYMQTKQKQLYDKAASNRWTVSLM